MGSILGAFAEALGFRWLFAPHDERPPHRRPRAAIRFAGAVIWVTTIAVLLGLYDYLMADLLA